MRGHGCPCRCDILDMTFQKNNRIKYLEQMTGNIQFVLYNAIKIPYFFKLNNTIVYDLYVDLLHHS